MSTAVIIGRFQPLHNGHVALINQAVKDNDNVLILVGSCNRERNFNNPYNTEERINMIANVFEQDGLDAPLVRGLKDRPTDDEWVQEVMANVMQVEEDPSKVTLYTSEKDKEFYESTFLYNTSIIESGGINASDFRPNLYSGIKSKFSFALTNVPRENWDYLESLVNDSFYDLGDERTMCLKGKKEALINHKFSNPIEPVAHAVVIHRGNILLVKRMGTRGKNQWAIPGGFMEHTETSREAAVRELFEETGVDLKTVKAKELAQAVEENIDDLSVRTLGINYMYLVDPLEELGITLDATEVSAYKWCPISDIVTEQEILFYNHNVIVQRLLSIVGEQNES